MMATSCLTLPVTPMLLSCLEWDISHKNTGEHGGADLHNVAAKISHLLTSFVLVNYKASETVLWPWCQLSVWPHA